MLSGGSLASNADLRQGPGGDWEIQGDPTEAAFLVAERKLGADRAAPRGASSASREIPFTLRPQDDVDDRARPRAGRRGSSSSPRARPTCCSARCTPRARRHGRASPFDDAARARAFADVESAARRGPAHARRRLPPARSGEEPLGADGARARPRLRRHGRHHRPAARRGGGRRSAKRTAPGSASS